MDYLIGSAIFLTLVLLIEGGIFAVRGIRNRDRKVLERRLRALASGRSSGEPIDIVRRRVLSKIPWLHALLSQIPGVAELGRILEQSDSRFSAGVFLLLSAVLIVIGLLVGSFVLGNVLTSVVGAALGGIIPLLYIYRQRQQRLLKFQRQLPEALDLVARALRAGHTFLVGMKMVSEEFVDPIGTEFGKTLAEINFGLGIPEALKNLAGRVDCPDLNFFVVSILIQRETGGNLAEIAENISSLIRKRFDLQDRVRALAAEGKFSAIILFVLPFFMGLVLFFLNPGYLGVLFTDPIGKGMLASAFLLMLIGVGVVKKMITIRV